LILNGWDQPTDHQQLDVINVVNLCLDCHGPGGCGWQRHLRWNPIEGLLLVTGQVSQVESLTFPAS
jgi:hypothetical protein